MLKYNIIKDVSELITTNRCIMNYMLSVQYTYPSMLKRDDYEKLISLADEKAKFIENKNNYYPYQQNNYKTNEEILKKFYNYSCFS
jgi:hypothetical protein